MPAVAIWAACGLAVAVVLALLLRAQAPAESPFASHVTVALDGVPYVVYLADTPAKRRAGYMNATSYDPAGVGAVGMLFLFGSNGTWCFWMKNTALPLKIVWISGSRTTAWALGRPMDESPICNYGDKVLELRPDLPVPMWVSVSNGLVTGQGGSSSPRG